MRLELVEHRTESNAQASKCSGAPENAGKLARPGIELAYQSTPLLNADHAA